MTCDVCGQHDPSGRSIDTLTIDVSAAAGAPEGRVWYSVNYCHDVRVCREGAEQEVRKFQERCGADNRIAKA